MQTYDNKARLRLVEGIRRQIGEIDTEIDELRKRQNEAAAAHDTLQRIEAVLNRMGMLAREAAKSDSRRPGLVEEFEQCKKIVEELSKEAVVDGKNVLREDDLRALMESVGL